MSRRGGARMERKWCCGDQVAVTDSGMDGPTLGISGEEALGQPVQPRVWGWEYKAS